MYHRSKFCTLFSVLRCHLRDLAVLVQRGSRYEPTIFGLDNISDGRPCINDLLTDLVNDASLLYSGTDLLEVLGEGIAAEHPQGTE
jgi:hypothetical protein